MKTIRVDCIRDGQVIYSVGAKVDAVSFAEIDLAGLIAQAKGELLALSIARPPYKGIEFEVHKE